MTAQHTLVPKHVANDWAFARFLVVSGSGRGKRFYDPATQRELTIHNIVNWVNQRINTDESAGWQELSHKLLRALLPQAEYRPNEKPVFTIEPGLFVNNIWAAPEIESDEKGDPSFLISCLDHAIGRQDREYVTKLLAWQYQRPLEKPHTGIYLFGAQGTGKSTITHILEKVLGSTAVMRVADQSKLGSLSNVNIWLRTLLIVEGVEVSLQDKFSNTIKSFMGTSYVDANRKHEHFGSYFIPPNLIMLSNNPPTMLEKDDRRWYVKEMAPQADLERYFKNLYQWLERYGCQAIAHLLATTHISDMNLSDRPRWTEEKEIACDMATKQDVLDVQKLVEEADGIVFTVYYFVDVCNGNRLIHIASDVGLKVANLNVLSGKTRAKGSGFSEAECKRLFVPVDVSIYQDCQKQNAWMVRFGDCTYTLEEARAKRCLF